MNTLDSLMMQADLANKEAREAGAGLGYDREVLAAAKRIEAAALELAALIDGANPDVCKRADALLLGRSNAPIGPRRASPPEWRRLFFCEVAETTLARAQHELTRRRGGE